MHNEAKFISEHFCYAKTLDEREILFADFNFSLFVITFVINLTENQIIGLPKTSIKYPSGEKIELNTKDDLLKIFAEIDNKSEIKNDSEKSPFITLDSKTFKKHLIENNMYKLFLDDVKSRGDNDLINHVNDTFGEHLLNVSLF